MRSIEIINWRYRTGDWSYNYGIKPISAVDYIEECDIAARSDNEKNPIKRRKLLNRKAERSQEDDILCYMGAYLNWYEYTGV